MRFLRNIIIGVALLAGLQACGGRGGNVLSGKEIVVTIPPLQGLVREIVGDDYRVRCMLPSGSSPESYSPTARQVAALAEAEFVFAVGTLHFESELLKRAENQDFAVINTAQGIELLTGCEHTHEAVESEHSHGGEAEAHRHSHNHNHKAHHHSFDPHVWLAPEELGMIAANIAEKVIAAHPDSVKYIANYEQLKAKLEEREVRYGEMLEAAPRGFLIYHPALGYLAAEYGLEQISLENEGKSPTPASLAEVVDRVEREGLKTMFYQQEYPLDVVKPIAEILGVNLVQINPLSGDIIGELDNIVTRLTNSNE